MVVLSHIQALIRAEVLDLQNGEQRGKPGWHFLVCDMGPNWNFPSAYFLCSSTKTSGVNIKVRCRTPDAGKNRTGHLL
jgi:hypothetical protein